MNTNTKTLERADQLLNGMTKQELLECYENCLVILRCEDYHQKTVESLLEVANTFCDRFLSLKTPVSEVCEIFATNQFSRSFLLASFYGRLVRSIP